jgi:enamine deaminase RidA (YjgF/YER057c/UK114 family)
LESRSVREVKGVAAWGHHAIATSAGGLAFVSALSGYDAARERIVLTPGDLAAADRATAERALAAHPPLSASEVAAAAQAASIFRQLDSVLASLGSSLADTLKITVHLREMRDFPVVQEVARMFFADNPPALAVVAVNDLPLPEERLQVEAVAAAGS